MFQHHRTVPSTYSHFAIGCAAPTRTKLNQETLSPQPTAETTPATEWLLWRINWCDVHARRTAYRNRSCVHGRVEGSETALFGRPKRARKFPAHHPTWKTPSSSDGHPSEFPTDSPATESTVMSLYRPRLPLRFSKFAVDEHVADRDRVVTLHTGDFKWYFVKSTFSLTYNQSMEPLRRLGGRCHCNVSNLSTARILLMIHQQQYRLLWCRRLTALQKTPNQLCSMAHFANFPALRPHNFLTPFPVSAHFGGPPLR